MQTLDQHQSASIVRTLQPNHLGAGPYDPAELSKRCKSGILQESCGCWSSVNQLPDRYASLTWNGRSEKGHRVAYRVYIREIPNGLVIDHKCKNVRCMNPHHLEAVTQKVNIQRGSSALKTECVRGHPFSPENTYITPHNGRRSCVTCRAMFRRRYAHTS